MPTLQVFVADPHGNSRLGLCPPSVPLADGGEYRPSKSQREAWSAWLEFWEMVEQLKKKYKARPVISHFVGDWVDINRHDSLDPITRFEPDVLAVGKAIARRPIEVSDVVFMYRGTEAHTGEHCKLEETLASILDKIEPDEQRGASSWGSWWGEIEGVAFDVQHHPVTMGSRRHTYQHAALRQSLEVELAYGRNDKPVPQWCIRAHGHRFVDSGEGTRPRTILLPGWKLSPHDAYLARRGHAGEVTPVGGVWFLLDGGEVVDWQVKLWRPKRARQRIWRYKK